MRHGAPVLAFLVAGCSPDQDLTALRPEIVVAPDRLDFGEVTVQGPDDRLLLADHHPTIAAEQGCQNEHD